MYRCSLREIYIKNNIPTRIYSFLAQVYLNILYSKILIDDYGFIFSIRFLLVILGYLMRRRPLFSCGMYSKMYVNEVECRMRVLDDMNLLLQITKLRLNWDYKLYVQGLGVRKVSNLGKWSDTSNESIHFKASMVLSWMVFRLSVS